MAPEPEPRLLPNRYAGQGVPPAQRSHCPCFRATSGVEHLFHRDPPHASERAWNIVCDIIDEVKRSGAIALDLGRRMDRADYMALNTLPDSIGGLSDLQTLITYGSNLSYLPRALGDCVNLRVFEPYTSYRLHWLPFEITRCRNLAHTVISTRALYGNYKNRPSFPALKHQRWTWPAGGMACSICGTVTHGVQQFWTSQRVATDVVPLLVSVCSETCRQRIGPGASGHVEQPHRGGLSLVQPPRRS